jgi:uroporphyrinogen-III decarboxylase
MTNTNKVDVEPYTYASKQATKCAQCGEHKHTPLRIDAMGGYVCLTCIDKKLGSLLGEFGYPEPEQEQVEPVLDDFIHKVVRYTQPHLDATCKDWKKEFDECKYWLKAAHAINTATKQEQAEPIAWAQPYSNEHVSIFKDKYHTVPLYTAPKGQTELLRQALEALESGDGWRQSDAISAIKQHLGDA